MVKRIINAWRVWRHREFLKPEEVSAVSSLVQGGALTDKQAQDVRDAAPQKPVPCNGQTKKVARDNFELTMARMRDLGPRTDEVVDLAEKVRQHVAARPHLATTK